MSYKRQNAPADLDTDGVRKYTEEQLLRMQRATAEMDKASAEIQGDITTLQSDVATLQTDVTALDGRVTTLETPGEGLGGGGGAALFVSLDYFTNALGADVALNNTANYFDGPQVAQGASGVWFVTGVVTLTGTAASEVWAKLWDGTSVISETSFPIFAATARATVHLSGIIANPAGNLRISCRDSFTTTSKIEYNRVGNSKGAVLSAFRIG